MQRLQSTLTRLRDASTVQEQSLEEQLAWKTSALAELEAKLQAQNDYEEIKRELRLYNVHVPVVGGNHIWGNLICKGPCFG